MTANGDKENILRLDSGDDCNSQDKDTLIITALHTAKG